MTYNRLVTDQSSIVNKLQNVQLLYRRSRAPKVIFELLWREFNAASAEFCEVDMRGKISTIHRAPPKTDRGPAISQSLPEKIKGQLIINQQLAEFARNDESIDLLQFVTNEYTELFRPAKLNASFFQDKGFQNIQSGLIIPILFFYTSAGDPESNKIRVCTRRLIVIAAKDTSLGTSEAYDQATRISKCLSVQYKKDSRIDDEVAWEKVDGRLIRASNAGTKDVFKNILLSLKDLSLEYATYWSFFSQAFCGSDDKKQLLIAEWAHNYRTGNSVFNYPPVIDLSIDEEDVGLASYAKTILDLVEQKRHKDDFEAFIADKEDNAKIFKKLDAKKVMLVPIVKFEQKDAEDVADHLEGILVLYPLRNFENYSLFNQKKLRYLSEKMIETIDQAKSKTKNDILEAIQLSTESFFTNIDGFLANSSKIIAQHMRAECRIFLPDNGGDQLCIAAADSSENQQPEKRRVAIKQHARTKEMVVFRDKKPDKECHVCCKDLIDQKCPCRDRVDPAQRCQSFIGRRIRDMENHHIGAIVCNNKRFDLNETLATCFSAYDADVLMFACEQIGRLLDLYNHYHYAMRFFKVLPHEIVNPMVSIIGRADELKKRLAAEQDRKCLDDILNTARTINLFMEGPLFSGGEGQLRHKASSRIPIDIYEVLVQWLQMFAPEMRRKHIEYELDRAKVEHLYLYIKKEHVDQIIYNVVSNAVSYSHIGTRLRISGEKHAAASKVVITNFGIGISEEEREEVYKIGYRAPSAIEHRDQGTGIGLFVTRNLMHAYNGKIDLSSTLIAEYNPALKLVIEKARMYGMGRLDVTEIEGVLAAITETDRNALTLSYVEKVLLSDGGERILKEFKSKQYSDEDIQYFVTRPTYKTNCVLSFPRSLEQKP